MECLRLRSDQGSASNSKAQNTTAAQTTQAHHNPGGGDRPEGKQIDELITVVGWIDQCIILDSRVNTVHPVVAEDEPNKNEEAKKWSDAAEESTWLVDFSWILSLLDKVNDRRQSLDEGVDDTRGTAYYQPEGDFWLNGAAVLIRGANDDLSNW